MTRTPLATSLDAYEVWFVTGSQSLYGEETLRQVADQSRRVAAGLDGLPVKVVWKPFLIEPDGIRRLALDANARDDVIGIVAWMHTFSPAKMWIAGLDALQKPLLPLHT
ncbi:MAG: L-arabinose isomerase, partial [Microbacterium sp.]|nr:L-arabinose isomerase [Microbacterium sp.]